MSRVIWVLAVMACCYAAPPPPANAECMCTENRTGNGWCDECGVGYIAAVRIESWKLYDAIDAHGHQVDPNTFDCVSCRRALEWEGFCDECKIGFVRGEAYFSRLTYYLAKGAPKSEGDGACSNCRKLIENARWCDTCKVGLVGHFAFTVRRDYQEAARARTVLLAAIRKAAECEGCAIAMAVDRRCYRCNISYDGGQRVTGPVGMQR